MGMLLPGLAPCGSAIQAASDLRVVGINPAAIYLAPANMGQIRADAAAAGVPRTV